MTVATFTRAGTMRIAHPLQDLHRRACLRDVMAVCQAMAACMMRGDDGIGRIVESVAALRRMEAETPRVDAVNSHEFYELLETGAFDDVADLMAKAGKSRLLDGSQPEDRARVAVYALNDSRTALRFLTHKIIVEDEDRDRLRALHGWPDEMHRKISCLFNENYRGLLEHELAAEIETRRDRLPYSPLYAGRPVLQLA